MTKGVQGLKKSIIAVVTGRSGVPRLWKKGTKGRIINRRGECNCHCAR